MAVFATYQLVLSRRVAASGNAWRPEVVYGLHLPPTQMDYRPRAATKVTPLFGAAHIESAPTILADLTLNLESGLAQMLSSDASGRPAVLSGPQRDRAMRQFMQTASERIAQDGWRMEFHADSRDIHVQVVVAGTGFTFSAGGMSRNGGAGVALQFTAVRRLDGPVGLIGSINAAIADVVAQAGVVAGAMAYRLDQAAQVVALPGAAANAANVAAQMRVVADKMLAVVAGTAASVSVPADTLRSARDAAVDITAAFVDAVDLYSAQIWHDLGELADAALAVTAATTNANVLAAQASGGDGTAAFEAFKAAQLSAGNAGAANYANPVQDAALVGLPAEYVGWLPYLVEAGDSLMDIAAATMGDASKWTAIAQLNGIDAWITDLQVGTTIKIPVAWGAIPFAATSQFGDPAAMQTAVEEYLYLVGFAVQAVPDLDGAVDLVVNDDDPRDVVLVTGVQSVVQRYGLLGFRTDLGANPTFPEFGVYLGIGRADNPALRALTRVSATQLLASDPRIVEATVLRDTETVDAVALEFDVRTVNAAFKLAAPGV